MKVIPFLAKDHSRNIKISYKLRMLLVIVFSPRFNQFIERRYLSKTFLEVRDKWRRLQITLLPVLIARGWVVGLSQQIYQLENHWVYLTLKFGKQPLNVTSIGGGKDLLGSIFIKWIGDHFFTFTQTFSQVSFSLHVIVLTTNSWIYTPWQWTVVHTSRFFCTWFQRFNPGIIIGPRKIVFAAKAKNFTQKMVNYTWLFPKFRYYIVPIFVQRYLS